MVRDRKKAQHILDILNTAQEESISLLSCLFMRDLSRAFFFMHNIDSMYSKMFKLIMNEDDDTYRRMLDYMTDADISLKRIKKYIEIEKIDIAKKKIEFELIPILRATYGTFYYKALIYPDQELIDDFINSGKMHELFKNYYYEESLKKNKWKYDASITITCFNKLKYTKLCLESIFRNLPQSFSYEIIVNNHGSTDGTKKYLERLSIDKEIDLAVNSNLSVAHFTTEGRYRISISNDVIITPNALDVMYEAIKSDDKIMWAVPSTSHVSNLQEPNNVKYSTLEELDAIALCINKRDIRKEERRVRLCNPITAYNDKVFYGFEGFPMLAYIVLNADRLAFPDDVLSLLVRRLGYKSVLLKDVYCHHFGSVTIGNISDRYLEGRKKFKARFGIDPWDSTCVYDPDLFEKISFCKKEPVRVLGINAGFGSNVLKIAETLRENGNDDTTIDNINLESAFDADLEPLSDIFLSMPLKEALLSLEHLYDYIVCDRNCFFSQSEEEIVDSIDLMVKKLTKDGVLLMHETNNIGGISGKEMTRIGQFMIFR